MRNLKDILREQLEYQKEDDYLFGDNSIEIEDFDIPKCPECGCEVFDYLWIDNDEKFECDRCGAELKMEIDDSDIDDFKYNVILI
jgi:uncharacterized paraquat-inducible protein A